jgi:hypothetical protein
MMNGRRRFIIGEEGVGWGRLWNYGYMTLAARFACCSGMQPGARQVGNTDGRGWLMLMQYKRGFYPFTSVKIRSFSSLCGRSQGTALLLFSLYRSLVAVKGRCALRP